MPDERKYPSLTTIDRKEYEAIVKEIFATIPRHYDFLNRFLSLRRDVAWRNAAAEKMRFLHSFRLLDIATGTADLALAAARFHPEAKVIGLDFAPEMMAISARKIATRHLAGRIALLQGDALALPLPDNSFDAAAMAFGIRNMSDRLRVLEEMRRVVVPGGQVMVLEMHEPPGRILKAGYRLYLDYLLPFTARRFSQNPAAYAYLAESIHRFPTPEAFSLLMAEAGLTSVSRQALTFGIAWLHIGIKPEKVD